MSKWRNKVRLHQRILHLIKKLNYIKIDTKPSSSGRTDLKEQKM